MKSTYAKQRGSVHAIVTMLIIIGLFSAVSFLFIQKITNRSSSHQQVSAFDGTVPVPEGWKKYESNQYGISFNTPKEWVVQEYGAATSGSKYIITIGAPQYSLTTGFDVSVYLGKVDDLIDAATKEYTKNPQYEVVSSSLKWNGYDARRLAVQQTHNPAGGTRAQLFAQVGEYVYAIPDSDHPPTVVADGKVTKSDWQKFIESLRIKNT